MYPEMKIKNETPATRCEVCHQDDCFNPLANFCTRCQQLTSEKDVPIKIKKYGVQTINHKGLRDSCDLLNASCKDTNYFLMADKEFLCIRVFELSQQKFYRFFQKIYYRKVDAEPSAIIRVDLGSLRCTMNSRKATTFLRDILALYLPAIAKILSCTSIIIEG